MAYDRTCVPTQKQIALRVIFLDYCGEPIDPDTDTLELYLYDPDTSLSTIETAIDDDDFGAADITVDPDDITRVETGYYEYLWTVPSGSTLGTWHDVWVGDIDSVSVAKVLTVEVVGGGSFATQSINENQLIIVELDETIAGLVSGYTLGSNQQVSFSTRYNPYYASPDLLRLEAGTWVDGIPDDTLSLMIHWSSIEADLMWASGTSGPLLAGAKTKFCVYDALIKVLMLPVGFGTGKKKALADLLIEQNGAAFEGIMRELKTQRREWLRVVNAGGNIVPGQGFNPTFAVKGLKDPDRRRIGRLWWGTDEFRYSQPTQNTKLRKVPGGRRFKHGFGSGSGGSGETRTSAPWIKDD